MGSGARNNVPQVLPGQPAALAAAAGEPGSGAFNFDDRRVAAAHVLALHETCKRHCDEASP
jgi:hypothetical protein